MPAGRWSRVSPRAKRSACSCRTGRSTWRSGSASPASAPWCRCSIPIWSASLAHCIKIVAPRHIIVAAEFIDRLATALPGPAGATQVGAHGAGPGSFPRIDVDIERYAGHKLGAAELRPLSVEDRALLMYTSGTTGLPKAANISHFRLMQWSHWFAGMMDTRPGDRMYSSLPMYHSVGGVLATGAVLVGGGSVVVREGFTARQFWDDILRWDCTLFQYIGELCRYLLRTDPLPHETQHRIRMCCGNGLRPDLWHGFKSRFRIPRILEFYAATEGNVSLFNIEGKPGAIGIEQRSEEHTSELQSQSNLVCRLLLEKKKKTNK